MAQLNWRLDPETEYWTRKLKILPGTRPAPQFGGRILKADTWESYLRASTFPDYCYVSGELWCSPTNIVRCFRDDRYLEGLALTVGWGKMERTKNKIYQREKAVVESVLADAADMTARSHSIEQAWKSLVGELGWSDVMASKTLHFMTRALGYEQNPGVAIDNAVIRQEFAPCYNDCVRKLGHDPMKMGNWWDTRSDSLSWSAYNNYMTAMCCLAEVAGWTTTEVEATVFARPTTFLQR